MLDAFAPGFDLLEAGIHSSLEVFEAGFDAFKSGFDASEASVEPAIASLNFVEAPFEAFHAGMRLAGLDQQHIE